MHEYTHNNHFQFGYNGQWGNSRLNDNDVLNIKFGKICRPVLSYRDECYNAARLIKKQADSLQLPIDVLFSGGKDSEVVVRSFFEQEIPVRVNILRFENNLNHHDIRDAFATCKKMQITPVIHEIDIMSFLENEYKQYAEKSQTFHASHFAMTWLLERLAGFPVMGVHLVQIVNEHYERYIYTDTTGRIRSRPVPTDIVGTKWQYMIPEKLNLVWRKFLTNTNRPGVIEFFAYTPELLVSYHNDKCCEEFLRNPDRGVLGDPNKFKIMEKHFPNLQQQHKLHGYEHIDLARMEAVVRDRLYQQYKMYDCMAHYDFKKLNEIL